MPEAYYGVVRHDSDNHYYDWDRLESALQRYADSLQMDIDVSVPHGEYKSPRNEEGRLCIRFYSCPPFDDFDRTALDSVYGVELDAGQVDALKPSNTLTTLLDSENAFPVAEFDPYNIYVLFDLTHGRHGGQLITYIMEDYMHYRRCLVSGRMEDFDAMILNRVVTSSRKHFGELLTDGIEEQISSVKSSIDEIEEAVRDLQRKIVRKGRERLELLRKLESLEIMTKKVDKGLIEEKFEALRRQAIGGEIVVTKNTIEIPAGQIDIEYEGEVYDIGEFTIVIYPNGDHGGVKCINHTRSVSNCNHPHVEEDGDVCLGNLASSIPDLIGNMDYEVVAIFMIQFLKTCNPDGWYEEVTSWPKKGETEEEWRNRLNQNDEEL